ncbi:MAG: hypothetical protein INF52_07845 [Rhodobacter sp.]|nr:hypothetical protein [Rhodobacter sp.]
MTDRIRSEKAVEWRAKARCDGAVLWPSPDAAGPLRPARARRARGGIIEGLTE